MKQVIIWAVELMNQTSFLGRSSVILIKDQIISFSTDKGSKKSVSQFSRNLWKQINLFTSAYLLNLPKSSQ